MRSQAGHRTMGLGVFSLGIHDKDGRQRVTISRHRLMRFTDDGK